MALSEAEELELLTLERERAMASSAPMSGKDLALQEGPKIASQAAQMALASGPINATQKFFNVDPATMQRVGGPLLPIAGGVVAGPAAPVGAAAGEFLRQMTGTALAPDTVPKTALGRMGSVAAQGAMAVSPEQVLKEVPGAAQASEAIGNAYQGAKKGVAKGWSKLMEPLIGKQPQKTMRLINDPTVALPKFLGGAKNAEEASKDYGRALGKADLTKPNINPFGGKGEIQERATETWEKWKSGYGEIDPQEAYDATQYVNYEMPAAVTERNGEKVRELSQFRDGMNDILSKQKGKFRQVAKDYGRSLLKRDFTQIFPRTQSGKISTVKSVIMPFVDPRRAPFLGLTSPALMGGITSAVVGGTRAVEQGLNVLGRNPQIRQTLLSLLQQLQRGKNNGTPQR